MFCAGGHVNRFLLLTSIIAAVLCSCQKPPSAAPDEPLLELPPVVSNRYFLHDDTCQASGNDRRPTQVYLTDFEQPLHLDGAQHSLSTAVVGSTYYGQTFQRRCHLHSKQEQLCLDRDLRPVPWTKTNTGGGALRICGKDYPKESYEHVALVTALHLQRAQRFFTHSTGQVVPSMSLLVMPFFRTLYTDEEGELQQRLLYRNIIYYPASKTLAVLPDRDNFEGRALWESPFIIAHEFAHHAQFAAKPRWASSLAASAHHKDKGSIAKRSLEAFLEGWADLYAFYAEGENPSDIISYPCFGYNRDTANPVFADRSLKVITPEIVADFYASTSTSSSCMRPDFSDTHIVGAVLAHHLHRIVSYVTSLTEEMPSPAHKYRYLHRWLTAVFEQVQDRGNDTDLLRTLVSLIYQTIAAQLAQLNPHSATRMTAQVCALFEAGFPALSGCSGDRYAPR